jgi:hypothetical protein
MVESIKVDGESYRIDIEELSSDKQNSTFRLGVLLAKAEREKVQAEAHYRAWRANLANEICKSSKKGTPPEWRVKAQVEADPNYLQFQNGIAEATRNTILLASALRSLEG